MILTNQNQIPLPLFEAIKADTYSRGDSDVTVTQLLKPVQQWALEQRHGECIAVDACDRLWATYGQLMALLLDRVVKASPELAARFRTEQRVRAIVEGWKVSGAFDIYDTQELILSDYKFVGGYSAKMARAGDKTEWWRQLNMLRWLKVQEEPLQPVPKKLEIVLLVRDYSLKKDKPAGLKPVEVIDIPIAPLESVGIWIKDRVQQFQRAAALPDWKLPDCDSEETWNGKRCADYCDVSQICFQNSK